MEAKLVDLPALFGKVAGDLDLQRESLNQADALNHNHGDHMVEIFKIAAQAAEDMRDAGLAKAMDCAAGMLVARPENGSAQVYARGLSLLASQFKERSIELEDLVPYVRNYLKEKKEGEAQEADRPAQAPEDPRPEASGEQKSIRSGEVLKALLAALAEWERVEASRLESSPGDADGEKPGSWLDMGYLFGVGMAYLGAKQKGGDKVDILSETVVSASPLSRVPHRHQSGVIAVRSLLEAMGES